MITVLFFWHIYHLIFSAWLIIDFPKFDSDFYLM